MTTPSRERLYALLPAVHRVRDAAEGGPLRALMAVFERELDAIATDLETTWDNWFVETCEEWVVPYLGEALGVRGLRSGGATPLRGYVANTIARRRRKGTAAATEQLARDVTRYPARAAEMFALTATTVQVNHVRGSGTVSLRDTAALARLGGAFDTAARTADVRPIADGVAHPNLPNLGLFLWRAQTREISASTARPTGTAGRFAVDPLGGPVPLFSLPRSEEDIVALAGPEHVPHPLSRVELDGLGADPPVAVRVVIGGAERELTVVACDLSGAGTARPPKGTAAVDPELGLLALAADDTPAEPDEVLVDHAHGAPGPLGADPGDRAAAWAEQLGDGDIDWQVLVSRDPGDTGEDGVVADLEAAVTAWNTSPATTGVIVLAGSRSYDPPTTPIQLDDGERLAIVAGGWPVHRDPDGVPHRVPGDVLAGGGRPHVRGGLTVTADPPGGAVRSTALALNGLLVEGAVQVGEGHLGVLDLSSCTVVGGLAVTGPGNVGLAVRMVRCITGRIVASAPAGDPVPVTALDATDCAVRAGDAGPDRAVDVPATALRLNGCTVVGGIRARTLEASECVLDEGRRPPARSMEIAVRQEGCVRYSYVPDRAVTPRRFRCQPDLALDGVGDPAEQARVRAALRPTYGSVELHTAGFLLLSPTCPAELRTAGADGSEPGVWHHLGHALRMSNLAAALRHYLRYGLEAAAIVDR